ncbi:SpoIIE family protein phosphatase [Paraconexibacter antarcticus]|uniref:SpoIIE family protein phosphatase n=1 Tax=Paraconexibacter antarcticus TaxID=2949664 RepID=A0ABY5DUG4_9ACTN|nr:SpoIIE family protein phosphatase [Paraconexibacter antarcticus]UTI64164.1 SpoIIE family protein phosphatase [Paraconexibacter antarcticus]
MTPSDALIADGETERAEAVRAELARHGHSVRVVADRETLLDHVADDGIRLIVLAPTFGTEPVATILEALRTLPRSSPAVVVVAGTREELDEQLVREVVELGVADVWELPDGVTATDVRLRLVLAEFYARLQAEHVRVGGEFTILRRALDLTGTGFVLTDPALEDNPIVYVNESFCRMTGYSPDEILGRNCRFLQRDVTDPESIAIMRDAIREHRPVAVTLSNVRRDGTVFQNEVHIAPVRDGHGRVVRFVGVQVDVTQHRDGRGDRLAMAEGSRRLAEAALRRTRFLSDAGPRLDATLDRRAALDALALLAVPALGTACVVLSVDGDVVRRDSASGAGSAIQEALDALPETRPATPGDPVLVAATGGGPLELDGTRALQALGATNGNGSATLEGLRGFAIPLPARGRTVGVLVILGPAPLGGDDAALAQDLAARAGLAVDNARLYEEQRQVAEQLQRETLPERPLRLPRASVATRYRAGGAGMRVGGDFFDAFPIEDGATLVVIGDVTGKGAPAAALATIARSTLRTAGTYEVSPAAILRTLNLTLLRHRAETSRGRFVSVAACRLDETPTGLRATLCLAGHPAPVLQRADGTVEVVGRGGTLLGFAPSPRLWEVAVDLGPKDRLILFTDGLSEAIEGDEEDRPVTVADLVEDTRDTSLDDLADRLLEASAAGRRADDVAICVLEVTPNRDRALRSV